MKAREERIENKLLKIKQIIERAQNDKAILNPRSKHPKRLVVNEIRTPEIVTKKQDREQAIRNRVEKDRLQKLQDLTRV